MRGHLVGFHFCPILLSGVALFLVTFSSSLHTDLSRDEVFKRVEGITWMCYTSVITPWYFFPTFCTLLIPLYTLLATTNPSFRRNVNVSGAMGESRIGWQILAKNSVRKTWGVSYLFLLWKRCCRLRCLTLRTSHIYITWVGVGGGGSRERERPQHFCCHNKSSQSIFFGHAFKLCQRRLILPPFHL